MLSTSESLNQVAPVAARTLLLPAYGCTFQTRRIFVISPTDRNQFLPGKPRTS